MTEDKTESPLEAAADNDQALLAQYNLAHLPEVFAMRDGDQIIQERAPCYRCAADGFYGLGTAGTWYEEGSIIAVSYTHLDVYKRQIRRTEECD